MTMTLSTRDSLAARHRSVHAALAAAALDALIVTRLPNIFYLTGFQSSAAILVITATKVSLLTDFRYVESVHRLLDGGAAWPDAALVRVEGSYDEALASLIDELPVRRVGFEAAHLPVSRHRWLTARLRASEGIAARPARRGGTRPSASSGRPEPVKGRQRAASWGSGPHDPIKAGRMHLVPTEGLVERVRIRKDAREVATLRAAAELLSEVARDVLRTVQAGPSEREFAAVIDYKLKSAGFAGPAFETIVAAGANAALPHARPGVRRLQTGDLVLLDFGGVYDGYCVDLTRTVCLGRPDDEMRRVYDAVAQAQRAALTAVKPGIPASSVDAAARAVLADRGLGEAFGHGTGHGLGVEVHEAPRLAPGPPAAGSPTAQGEAPGVETEVIAEGMVFTIEPGAYLSGWGGVRLEDDVLVTADGCEVLTDVPRDLVVG